MGLPLAALMPRWTATTCKQHAASMQDTLVNMCLHRTLSMQVQPPAAQPTGREGLRCSCGCGLSQVHAGVHSWIRSPFNLLEMQASLYSYSIGYCPVRGA